MGHGGYREGKIIAEFSTEVEESQKRAQRSDQRLRCRHPTLSGPFQEKISNCPCFPSGDIITERSD
jgi:hypothetical protein